MNRRHFIASTLTAAAAALTGCVSRPKVPILTPERVRAVSAVAAYYGARAAIAAGERDAIERLVAGLQTLIEQERADAPTVIAALEAAGIALVAGEEGQFLLNSGLILFADFWAASGQVVLDQPLVRSFAAGIVQGATLALRPAVTTRSAADPGAELARAARATGP
jgi:hypothetical protein